MHPPCNQPLVVCFPFLEMEQNVTLVTSSITTGCRGLVRSQTVLDDSNNILTNSEGFSSKVTSHIYQRGREFCELPCMHKWNNTGDTLTCTTQYENVVLNSTQKFFKKAVV